MDTTHDDMHPAHVRNRILAAVALAAVMEDCDARPDDIPRMNDEARRTAVTIAGVRGMGVDPATWDEVQTVMARRAAVHARLTAARVIEAATRP